MRAPLFFFLCLGGVSCWSPNVTIKQGALRGIELKSRGGHTFHSFLGIPYAKAPEGDLRFQAPQPHPGWQGILDASKEGDMCVQDMILLPQLSGIPFGKEDCLYINVHTPIGRLDSTRKLAVMVWIYGGAFQLGDGGNQTYGPTFLMDRDVVYVNFNYRLGVLGFLSFETTSVPGNYGLKDQQLALQWVKDNIEVFGGDPESITIFGESAGAASVHYQIVSPKSQGLFHKAIMQSGSSFCPWALAPLGIARDRANALASLLGCHGSEEEKVACLRSVPSDAILKTQLKFMEWGTDPLVAFIPVIEPEHPGAFISKHPLEYESSPDIPLIIGVNQDEGAIRTARLCSNNMLELNHLNDRWTRYLPMALMLRETVESKDLPQVVDTVSEFYLSGSKVDANNIRSLSDMYSDLLINMGVIRAAELYTGPVYFYLYNYNSKVTWTSVFGTCPISLGVSHADEMVNLFNLDSLFKDHNLEGKDLEMSETILSLWTNFAADGLPKDDSGKIQWPQFGSSKQYLAFDQNEIHIAERPFQERYQFVQSLPYKRDLELSKKTLGSKTEL